MNASMANERKLVVMLEKLTGQQSYNHNNSAGNKYKLIEMKYTLLHTMILINT